MRFLIDECLHHSIVAIAEAHGYEASHVNWLGLGGQTDWNLMLRIVEDDYTFVTNNARDFRKLYSREELHAGLVIIVPQLVPERQREIFAAILVRIASLGELTNEVIEVALENDEVVVTRYALPDH